ncbi:E3 ubiquitin/ISG15 ligase TRIM25 isoform X1 [Chelonia mydas]|uniref:E3 ubiquitin/ISG15 ligase TRIM25 isoform X1 n=1 Tax=Chelonia mydas TaxID=8469 RepID=UPI0018A22000|nr:E3 ubiquitin/ISG15 ligase TRIM25 isoform X1 [Chelonia mydas]XP_043408924.1 E3 ubiquitin/ISG15 ligase TRIM25 isoform X1 [Chelonia mydas]
MAEAEEEFRAAADLEDELSCPICLCFYRNPVSLSCHHSFCKECIQKALAAQQQAKATYSCPMCKVQLGPFLELHKNFQLCSIVEKFQTTSSKGKQGKEKASPQEKEIIPCDFCLDEPHTAVKTCLTCEASLCQAHLSKHSAKAAQKDHVLVEPSDNSSLQERKCGEHGKLLECYCEDDLVFVCMMCSITDSHKGHNIITLKEEYDKKLVVLSHTVKLMQENKSAMNKTLGELQKSENQLQLNKKTLNAQLSNLFKEIKAEVDQKEKQILANIQSSEKKQLSDIATLKKQTEKKRDEAVKGLQNLQMLSAQTDPFCFLREFKLAQDRINNQDFSTDSMEVLALQLDQATIAGVRSRTQQYISNLDSLMQVMQSQFINQTQRNSATCVLMGTNIQCCLLTYRAAPDFRENFHFQGNPNTFFFNKNSMFSGTSAFSWK